MPGSRFIPRRRKGADAVMIGPRLVACDIDGTLLRDDGTISTFTRHMLNRLNRAGVDFLLVTGRPVRTLPQVLRQTATTGVVVCLNGSASYDPVHMRVLDRTTIAPAALREVIHTLRRLFADVVFAAEVDGGRWLMCEPAYPLDQGTPWSRRVELPLLVHQPVCKFLAKVHEDDPDALLAAVDARLDGVVEVDTTRCPGVLEMTATGVTKATALARLAAASGIRSERVVAFGDMPSDLAMLTWAGVGVAMANAHPAVLARAAQLTSSNNDDGVAHYLDALLAAGEAARR
jgi:Cof subfamily protein (haloacid dehalogenase superfamily)